MPKRNETDVVETSLLTQFQERSGLFALSHRLDSAEVPRKRTKLCGLDIHIGSDIAAEPTASRILSDEPFRKMNISVHNDTNT